jgi:predicted O-methyltransferase YrrM
MKGSTSMNDSLLNPPSFSNQLLQHLKRKWNKKIGKFEEIPWMAQKEKDIMVEALTKLKPERCLEWGSGFSTLTFPNLLSHDAEWVSVEHNEAWHKIITEKDVPQQVKFAQVAADKVSTDEPDGSYDDFKSYIEYPNGSFDFILIDGRARTHCLKKAYDLISETGLIMLHDANRDSYLENTSMFNNQYLFTDHRKTFGGIWLGSKSKQINSFLDLRLHQNLWDKHFNLLRVMRPFAKR